MSSDSADDTSLEGKSPTVCFLCRQRKTKCDRGLPSCGFCLKAKAKCQYVPRPKKRGLRAGYVTHLEGRIEELEQNVRVLRDGQAEVMQTPTSQAPLPAATSSQPPLSSPTPITTSGKHRRLVFESDAAVRDLKTLPLTYIYTLADLWFKETHPWLSIMNYQHIQGALQELVEPIDHIEDIELRAIIALQMSHSTQAIVLGYKGRHQLAQYLRAQIMTEAMATPSISSVRALVIVAFFDYGNDNIPSVFNILSMCRRTAEHLGLFRRLLVQIEHESPSQVGPPSRTAFDEDDRSRIAVVWSVLALDAVSTLGVPWRDVSAALVDHLSSVAYVSAPDLRDSYKAHIHLCAIGLQPVHTFIHEFANGLLASEDTLTKCDEMYNNLMTYVHSQPPSGYTILADGLVDFDPCLVHTSVLTYAAIILMYEVLIDLSTGVPLIAVGRCNQACQGMVMTIRSISDADAELNTPLLSTFLFVAARFKLVMYRAQNSQRENEFDTLMHGISMCGRRWHVARRFDVVLRAAIFEVDSGSPSGLPADFWDLKKSQLDISEETKEWVLQHESELFAGALNGPYPYV